LEPLSNIELFYSTEVEAENLIIRDDEYHHCVKVFRKKINDLIYVTNGAGIIFKALIKQISRDFLVCEIIEKIKRVNQYDNNVICIPLLKKKDRFKFAIEKSVEMGITRFCFFISERTLVTKFDETRVKKIMIEAMKQSLQAHLPQVQFFSSLMGIVNFANENKNRLICFDLEAKKFFNKDFISNNELTFFLFGPEGGLSKSELELFKDDYIYKLSDSRLRTETAIVKLVSIIT
jgi:16S rRNA (uracil1498-N3)-methyltransferase